MKKMICFVFVVLFASSFFFSFAFAAEKEKRLTSEQQKKFEMLKMVYTPEQDEKLKQEVDLVKMFGIISILMVLAFLVAIFIYARRKTTQDYRLKFNHQGKIITFYPRIEDSILINPYLKDGVMKVVKIPFDKLNEDSLIKSFKTNLSKTSFKLVEMINANQKKYGRVFIREIPS